VNPGTDWTDQARRLVEVLRGVVGTPDPDDRSAEGDADECRWCPLCQLIAVLRGQRPEVTAVLADVLRTTADALHAFAAAPDGPRPAYAPADRKASEDDAPPVVQRIEIA
jgi:hypothetical protein